MHYIVLTTGMLGGLTARVVTSEGEATHVERQLLDQERAARRQAEEDGARARAEVARARAALDQANAYLSQQERAIQALRQAKEEALREKRNWRRRALGLVGLRDGESRQRYLYHERSGQWYEVRTEILDCEPDDRDKALKKAEVIAGHGGGTPSQVWRHRGVWQAEIRVPVAVPRR
ncbi:hypothetical protein [Nitrospira sp. Kam-Ns4a]